MIYSLVYVIWDMKEQRGCENEEKRTMQHHQVQIEKKKGILGHKNKRRQECEGFDVANDG